MVFDLASDAEGDVSGRFVPYGEAANRALVEATLAPFRGRLPPGITAQVAAYPGTSACQRWRTVRPRRAGVDSAAWASASWPSTCTSPSPRSRARSTTAPR